MIPCTSPSSTDEKIISVRDLKYVYDNKVQALQGITLDIRKGEYLALVGGNGSGKTTLAKHFNGLLRPTGGTVAVHGRPAAECTVAGLARIVGYAFQNPDHQLFCPTVEEEVAFGPRNIGYDEKEVAVKAERAIEAMGIRHLKGRAPLSLPLGERRRVSIASVIAMDPEVIILDEPTTGLDAEEIKDLMSSVDRLNREGKTIILITHDMKLVAQHARRVVVLSKGMVSLDSDPRGAFSDLDLLRESNLLPPPVTILAHRLSDCGIPKDILSPEELVVRILLIGGGAA